MNDDKLLFNELFIMDTQGKKLRGSETHKMLREDNFIKIATIQEKQNLDENPNRLKYIGIAAALILITIIATVAYQLGFYHSNSNKVTEEIIEHHNSIPHAEPARRPIRLIYSHSETIYCDGVYHGPDWEYDYTQSAFYYNLGEDLNRNFFEICFEYYVSLEQGDYYNNLITLSSSHREFGLRISQAGDLIITTDNGRNSFETEINIVNGEWNKIDLIYDNGNLYINNKYIHIGKLDNDGDNILSSINFAGGNCFCGWLRNISIKSDY